MTGHRVKTSLLLIALVLANIRFAEAQQPGKLPRIGFIGFDSIPEREGAFKKGLYDLGYLEGKNIAIEWRSADGSLERLPKIVAEVLRLNLDVIVTNGAQVTQAVKRATQTVPVVMGVSGDPVGTGVVNSLARPGGNITGLSIMSPELTGKRLELLKEVVPRVSRIGVLWNPTVPDKLLDFKSTEIAARSVSVRIESFEVRQPNDFTHSFRAISEAHPDALMALGEPLINSKRKEIVDFAARSRLPTIYEGRVFERSGGLMVYGADVTELFRRAAVYVDKILKGANPADLPVEQPTKLELIINLKTAKQIGLTIPPDVLARADKVIK